MLTLLRRIIIWSIILFFVVFFGIFFFIEYKGKPFVEKNLSLLFQRHVQIDNFRILSPLDVRFDNIYIDGLLQAKRVKVHLGVPDLIHKKLVIDEILLSEPFFVIQRREGTKWFIGEQSPPLKSSEATSSTPSSGNQNLGKQNKILKYWPENFSLSINKLSIQGGQVKLFDHSWKKDFQLIIAKLNMNIRSISCPLISVNSKYNLIGSLFGSGMPFSGDAIKSQGWINFYKKDMDASLYIVGADGKDVLSVNLASQNNDMNIKGKINIRNVPQNNEQRDQQASSFEGFVFGALQTSGVEIGVDFSVKTKMDDIHPDSISFTGNIGYTAPPKKEQVPPESNVNDSSVQK